MQRFGRLARRRRAEAGLSQEALAGMAGLHRTYVSLLERGRRAPTIDVLSRLAAALGTTMVSLVEELERAEAGEPESPRGRKAKA